MKLNKKKELATRTFKVGKNKVIFIESRLDDIKEAITKQDIRDLQKDGAIIIKPKKGVKKTLKKKSKKGVGSVRKKVKTRKRDYVVLTRKLRKYIVDLKARGMISPEEVTQIRKDIRNKVFRSKAHLKEIIGGRRKWGFKKEGEEKVRQIMQRD